MLPKLCLHLVTGCLTLPDWSKKDFYKKSQTTVFAARIAHFAKMLSNSVKNSDFQNAPKVDKTLFAPCNKLSHHPPLFGNHFYENSETSSFSVKIAHF